MALLIIGYILGFATPFVVRFRAEIIEEMKEYLQIGRKKQN